MITRRTTVVALGAGALTFPLPSFAQQRIKIPNSILVQATKVIE